MIKYFKILFFFFFLFVWSGSVFAKNWYLNDGSLVGDVYCTAVGAAGNTGLSPSSPKLLTGTSNVLQTVFNSATAGDIIYIDKLSFQIATTAVGYYLNVSKAITIIGAGPTNTVITGKSTDYFAKISTSNVVFKNFYLKGFANTASGEGSTVNIVDGGANLTGIVFDAFWMDQAVGSGGDGVCNITSTTGSINATIKNMLSTCNYNGTFGGGFTINGDRNNITFSACYFAYNKREDNGGAISIYGSNSNIGTTTTVTIDKCKFTNNGNFSSSAVTALGGSIYVEGAYLIVTNSCFSNNCSLNNSDVGTAIGGGQNARLNISNSTFSNQSGVAKGQIGLNSSYSKNSPSGFNYLKVDQCSFDNSTTGSSRCIYNKSSGTFIVNNCTFTSSSGVNQIYSSSTWTLTNSAISAGTNPVYSLGVAPTTVNTLAPSALPSPTCSGSISGSCGSLSISCSSDNLPPVIKAHDSTYVTNSTCTFTVPTYTATDICDGSPTVTSVPASGTALAAGTVTSVVITATDASGNSTSITVNLTTPACTPVCSGTLTSVVGTNSQTICLVSSISNITYSTAVATGISNDGVSGGNGLPSGVRATWSANVITISGTPTSSGTFNYSITLTGGTCAGQTVTGTINVTAANTVGSASSTPTLCINTTLTNITHTTTGATGIGTATGLPTGVTAAWASNTITISGTPSVSGTYSYSIPLTGGCGSVNATGTINVTAAITLTATPTQIVCNGGTGSVSLSSTGAAPLVYGGDATTNLLAGTYTYSVTDANGCVANASATIYFDVTALTKPIFTAISPICYGDTFSLPLISVNNIKGSWSPVINSTVSTIYTFTPDLGECASTATLKVDIVENYKISLTSDLASDSQKVCLNTAIGAIEYTLEGVTKATVHNLPAGISVNIVANKVILSGAPTEIGTFDFVIKPTGGCGKDSAIGQIIVEEQLIPSVSITSSDADNIICSGSSVTFTAHPVNGGSSPMYQWKINGSAIIGENKITFTSSNLIDGDKITVEMNSNLKCISSSISISNTIPITIGTNLIPTFDIKSEICEDENYMLPTVSNEGVIGVWTPKMNLKNTTKYTFTPTVLSCYTTKELTLVVNSLPVVNSIVTTNNVCDNSATDIKLSSSVINTDYSWVATPSANVIGAVDGNGSNINQLLKLSDNLVGSVKYTITPSANTCVGLPISVNLNVYPVVQPSVFIEVTNMPMNSTKDTVTLCPDDNVVFKATALNAGAKPIFQWIVNKSKVGLDSDSYSSGKIKDKDSISLILTSSQICASPLTVVSNKITAVVRANPLKVTAESTLTCNGSDGSITMKGDAKGDIVWKLGADLVGDSQNVVLQTIPNSPFIINKLKSGTYNVTFDNHICIYQFPATVSEPSNPIPPSALISNKVAPVCSGDSIQLTVKFEEDTPSSYIWIKDNLDTLKQTSQSIWVKDGGIYGASIVMSGCVSDILDTTLTFELKPSKLSVSQLAQPTCFVAYGNVKLSNLPSSNWKINTIPSIGSVINGFGNTYDLLDLNPSTTYSISVQNDLGCFSDTIQVKINSKLVPPSPPILTGIVQPSCDVNTGSVLLTTLPLGKWIVTSTPQTTTINGNGGSQLISNLKDNTTYTFIVTDSNGCSSSNSNPLNVKKYFGKPSAPTIQSPQTFCLSDNPKVSNLSTSSATSPVWYKNATTVDVYTLDELLTQNGSYYISQNVNGCESERVKVSVKLNVGPKFPSISPVNYCASDYNKINDLVKKIGSTNSTLAIFDVSSGGKSLALFDTLVAKDYYYLADSAGCKSSARQKITVNISNGTLPVLTTTVPAICSSNNITFADLSKEVGVSNGLLWYTLNKGGVAATITDKINFPPMSQTFYVAYKPNQTGVCESKDRVKVTVNLILTPTNVTLKDHFYEPCKDANETVANLPTTPYTSNEIAWFSNSNMLYPLKSTDQLYAQNYYAAAYSVDPISGKKCYSNSKEIVNVHLYNVAFLSYPENSSCDKGTGVLTIEEKNIQGYAPFSIKVKDQYGTVVGSSFKTNNLKTGEYTIEVTDAKQCKHTVTEMIGCTEINLPRIITPDGDGKNDTWIIQYFEKYPNVQVSIYNRWGSKVYTSAIPYMDNWDGRPSTDILTIGEGYLPTGTYFYVIDKGNGDTVESGYIELIK